jgi:hypothetical protein
VTIDGIWIGFSIYWQHSELHFTDHWHTQTSVLSLLQSPLAVSWQWLLPREILQFPALRSSCHSRPWRTLCQLPTQLTGSQAGGHFTPTSQSQADFQLTNDGWSANWTLSLTNQLLHATSFNWTADNYKQQLTCSFKRFCLLYLGTGHIENTVSIVIAQQYLKLYLKMGVCLLAYCIARVAVYRTTV